VLVDGRRGPRLGFNLSRSGSLALYAVTGGERVGVDVERMRDDVDALRVADRLFSPAERQALRRLPASRRRAAFFSCWTRKEAYAKALGSGLGLRFSSFTVSLAPAPAAPLRADGRPSDWKIWDAAPARGYAGAVAAEGGELDLRRWEITYP
jgi:4'-phosphopantetheinyl transferase